MASVIIAGKDNSDHAQFAKDFSAKYLKRNAEVINQSNFSKVLPKIDNSTIVFASDGFTLGANQKKFVKTLKERNATIVFKNATASAMKGHVAVGVPGQYVVVNNAACGSKQRIIKIDTAPIKLERSTEHKMIEHASTDPDVHLAREPPRDDEAQEETVGSVSAVDPEAVEKVLARWLKDDRFKQVHGRAGSTADKSYQVETILVLSTVSDTLRFRAGSRDNTTDIESFYAISISVYASNDPVNRKFIKFTQNDACGMAVRGAHDDMWEFVGAFNDIGKTFICPGTQGCGGWYQSDNLPQGWIRIHVAPHTPNTDTTYVSTTGWGISVSGEGDSGGGGGGEPVPVQASGKLSLKVTANYDQSNQVQKTIPDFSVRNLSDGRMSGWEFYCTSMDNYWNHCYYQAFWGYVIRKLPALAKSTLHWNAEAVYQGPEDFVAEMPWTIHYRAYFGVVKSKGNVFVKDIIKDHYYFTRCENITLYLDEVTVPA